MAHQVQHVRVSLAENFRRAPPLSLAGSNVSGGGE